MPYFSFILNQKNNNEFLEKCISLNLFLKVNKKYYSKNTKIWKLFNKKTNLNNFLLLKKETIFSCTHITKNIFFFLPPSIGLGDAIEYALAIKSIVINKDIKCYGIGFTGRYKLIFSKFFGLKNLYENIILSSDLNKFDSIFHFSKNIKSLHAHKYDRVNLEKKIVEFFRVPLFRFKYNNIMVNANVQKIHIYPLSTSPIRTMPLEIILTIVEEFSNTFNIEIVLNDESEFSKIFFKNEYLKKNVIFSFPENIPSLLHVIEKTQYGIFVDSGPLHVAKILNIKGILLISSISANKLIYKFNSIRAVQGIYKSLFCNGPCGLINALNYNNNFGCYDHLNINKEELSNIDNFKNLQRGNLKLNYLDIFKKGVNCFKGIDLKKLTNLIKKDIL